METNARQETGRGENPLAVYVREVRSDGDRTRFEIVSTRDRSIVGSEESESAAVAVARRWGWEVLEHRSIEFALGTGPAHPAAAAILARTLYRIRYEPIGDAEAPADEILTEIEEIAELALRSVGIVPAQAGGDPLDRFASSCNVCDAQISEVGVGECAGCRVLVIEAMSSLGGSFVRSLAEAMRRADPANGHRLRDAFPDIWNRYREETRRSLARKAAGS